MITLYAHLLTMSVRSGQDRETGTDHRRVGSTERIHRCPFALRIDERFTLFNPSQLRMVGAERLNQQQMAEFENQKSRIRELMNQYNRPQVPA